MNLYRLAEQLTREFGVRCIAYSGAIWVDTPGQSKDESRALRERIGQRRDELMAGESMTGSHQDETSA